MDKLFCLALNGFNHSRVAMPRIADSNPGVEIEEVISIDILDPDSLSLFHHKRIDAGVGLGDKPLIPVEDLFRLRAGKLSDNGWDRMSGRHLFFSLGYLYDRTKRSSEKYMKFCLLSQPIFLFTWNVSEVVKKLNSPKKIGMVLLENLHASVKHSLHLRVRSGRWIPYFYAGHVLEEDGQAGMIILSPTLREQRATR